MRALLDLLRDHEAVECEVSELLFILRDASAHLNILDPGRGGEELVKSMEFESAKLQR